MSKYKVGNIVYLYCINRLDIIEVTEIIEKEGCITKYNGKLLNAEKMKIMIEGFEAEVYDLSENALSPTIFDLIQNVKKNVDRDYYSYRKEALSITKN